jgi:hypothetical protein
MEAAGNTTTIVSLTPSRTTERQAELLQKQFGDITLVDHGFVLPQTPKRVIAELKEKVSLYDPDIVIVEAGAGNVGSAKALVLAEILTHPEFENLTFLDEKRSGGDPGEFERYEVIG